MLDWELCTLGDPMADVGYLMNNWVSPDELSADTPAPTQAGGFATRSQMLDLAAVDCFRAFSYWRLAAISEGVLNRYPRGVMADADETDTEQFRENVDFLSANTAERLAVH